MGQGWVWRGTVSLDEARRGKTRNASGVGQTISDESPMIRTVREQRGVAWQGQAGRGLATQGKISAGCGGQTSYPASPMTHFAEDFGQIVEHTQI